MNADLPTLLEAFPDLRVAVVGEAMLDSYLAGSAERLCREAPVPIVTLGGRTDAPGGAANTAANLRALGARVSFLSVVGADESGARVLAALERAGVPTEDVLEARGRRTLTKTRVLAEGQMVVRFDEGDQGPVDADIEDRLIERLTSLYHRCQAIIVSDYGYGVLTPRLQAVLQELQARLPRVLVVDARDLAGYRRVGVTAVKPNYAEAVRLLGELPHAGVRERVAQVAAGGERLLELTNARIVALTLDTDGSIVFERGRPAYRTYARPTSHSRAAGAGDTYVSALALALAAGATTPAAAELAAAAAAIVVAKDGTSTCSRRDLREHLLAGDKALGPERVAERAAFYHRLGRRIVFTNGCFDILHRGHITYLNRAKALGDVLVVGVNSDAGVQRLKGPDRPINALEDRLQVLSALSCIDHIVAFDEDTPVELIRAIRPDVYVKGGDYTRERLPEASVVEALGGEVQILPYVEDRSTTNVIARVRAKHDDGDGRRAWDGRPRRRDDAPDRSRPVHGEPVVRRAAAASSGGAPGGADRGTEAR
ncbi:MAG TPA: D-glycero-beta-D-manno-heptose 1-phosphate adenylyltransferase [Candidatus Limnocylindrales bacterium]